MADVTPLYPGTARAPRAAGAQPAPAMGLAWLDWWRAWAEAWTRAVYLPLSGPVVQDIAPETHWFSPTLEFNIAGNRRIEADVVANVASYGKQLGIVTEALLALAGEASEADTPEVKRLRALAARIETRKDRHKADLAETAQRALEDLEQADPAAYARLIESRAKQTT